MHGHRTSPHSFQGCLYLCFPGLGFSFLKIKEPRIGLFENLDNPLQDMILFICKRDFPVIGHRYRGILGNGERIGKPWRFLDELLAFFGNFNACGVYEEMIEKMILVLLIKILCEKGFTIFFSLRQLGED